LVVTLGDRGAAYVVSPAFKEHPLEWKDTGLAPERPLAVPGPAKSGLVPPAREGEAVDPTGCGDGWGATFFARLLDGEALVPAMRSANKAAARNAAHRGATGLHLHLQERLVS